MKKKLLGILVMTLLIASGIVSATTTKTEKIDMEMKKSMKVKDFPEGATKEGYGIIKLNNNELPVSVSGIDLIQLDAFMSTQPDDFEGDHRTDEPSIGTNVYFHSIFQVVGGTTPECICVVGVDLDCDGIIDGNQDEPYCYVQDSFPPNEPGYAYYFYCDSWSVIKGPADDNILGGIADATSVVSEDDENNNVVAYQWTPTGGTNHPPYTPSKPSGPTSGTVGVEYAYSTSTTDPDPGDQVKYGWDFDADGIVEPDHWTGFLASGAPCNVDITFNVEGTYYMNVKAEDEHCAQSDFSPMLTVVITTDNIQPTAIIDSISPNPAKEGESVAFKGTGTDSDGNVVAYEWSSSIDGKFSSEEDPSYSGLSVGTHTISFRVQDDDDAWSTEVSQTLKINPAINNPPNKPIITGPYRGYGAVDYVYWYTFCATDPDDDQLMYIIQWKGEYFEKRTDFYDSGDEADSYLIWSNPGTYKIRAKASDGELESKWSDPYEVTIYEKLPDISLYYWPTWNWYFSIEFEGGEPTQGGKFRIGYIIENLGNDWILESKNFDIRIRKDGAILATVETDLWEDIPPSDISRQYFTDFDYTWPSDGDYHTISVEMDVHNDITEVYESNNYRERKYKVDGCCFPAGTKITMADGSHKNIEDIKKGDRVLSYNIRQDRFTSWTVKMLGHPIHPVFEINSGLVSATVDHPFYIKKSDGRLGFGAYDPGRAKNAITYTEEVLPLEIDDKLLTKEGGWIEITDIEYNPEPVQTYNILSFSGTKTYFANDVLVYEEHPPHGMTNYFLRLLGEKFPWLEQFLLSNPFFNKLLKFLP